MNRILKACACFVALVAPLATSAQDTKITIGAGQQGSRNYAINAAIASLLTENGFSVRLESYGGSGAALPLLDVGDIDLVATTSSDLIEAIEGTEAFAGITHEQLRALAALIPAASGFFVRADSPVQSLSDIKGMAIGYGFATQPSIRQDIDAILANGGLSIDDMEQVLVPSVTANADEFMAGNTDVGYFAVSSGKMVEVDAAVGGVRFLSVGTEIDAVARQQALVPSSYVISIPQSEGSVGIDSSLDAFARDYVLVTRADLPDEIAAQIVTIMHDNGAELQAQRPLADFDPKRMSRAVADVPYHPGAIATYSEMGM